MLGTELQRVQEIDRGVETEQAFLGLLMRSEERTALPPLDDYTWADGAHRHIYATIRKIRDGGKPAANPAIVHAQMPHEAGAYAKMGGMRYLLALVTLAPLVCGASAEAEHVEMLRERAAKIGLIDIAAELVELVGNPATGARQALDKVWPALEAIRAGGAVSGTNYRELVRAKVERLKGAAVVYPTQIPALDDAMQGGLWPKKLYGIAARRKHGKSLMLGTVALNLANAGTRGLYVTLEQGPDEVTDRMAASELGVNAIAFLKRDTPGLSARVAAYAEHAPDCLLFEDRNGLTFGELRSMLGRYVAREKIKVFILDYWQLVQGCERGQTEAGFLGQVAQWLADAARAYDIAILTAAQINRDGNTLGSDGLRRACSMYLHQKKTEPDPANPGKPEELWLEMEDTRYTPRLDVGAEDRPLLFIDRVGPAVRQWGS